MTPEEKKAAVKFTVAGLLLLGPMGGLVAALAVAVEQAFAKSGWDKPALFGGSTMTAEQLADRRRQLAAEAEEYFRQAHARAAVRAAARAQHRERMSNWEKSNRDGDKPARADGLVRSPWEFLKDHLAASKAGYRLIDEKLARGNEKITGTYPKIGEFFRGLFNFTTGFVEGARAGWQQWQAERQAAEQQEPEGSPSAEQGPDHELPPEDDRPLIDPPQTDHPEIEPAAAGGAGPDSGPGEPPGLEPAAELPTEPAGSREGTLEGDVMTADGTAVLPAGAGSPAARAGQGETNLDLIYQAFHQVPPLLRSVDAQLPDLQTRQARIDSRIVHLCELAHLFGVPTEVLNYLAETAQASSALASGLKAIQLENARATELADAAVAGLRPAAENLDTVRSQGASGELLADAAAAA
jgi:hypothetical protein